jgi:hypothetical protein
MADQPVPAPDLRAAALSTVPELVTPFQVRSENGGQTITLIGAYADSARTVLFLRVNPDAGTPELSLSDDLGLMDMAGSMREAAPGDYVVTLNSGPRVGPGHIAHLTAEVTGLSAPPTVLGPPQALKGNWTLSFELSVQPATALPHESPFRLGSWTVTIEVLEVTPAVVHLQAVIDGARVEEVNAGLEPMISLVDRSGAPVSTVGMFAMTTIAEDELNPATGPPNSARVDMQWLRPGAAGTYQLRFRGNGETRTIAITLPALPSA